MNDWSSVYTKWSPLLFLCRKTQIINMKSLEYTTQKSVGWHFPVNQYYLGDLQSSRMAIYPFSESFKFLFFGSSTQHNPIGAMHLRLNLLLGKVKRAVESCKWHGSFQTGVCNLLRLWNVRGWLSLCLYTSRVTLNSEVYIPLRSWRNCYRVITKRLFYFFVSWIYLLSGRIIFMP